MKRFILLLVCCSFLVGNSVYALSKVEVDGLFYYLNEDDKTAILTKGWPLYSGDVIIPETINYEGKTYSVTKIDGGAFSTCKDLNSVTISGGVKEIGSYSFYSCKKLSSVILPDGLTSIGEEAFEECTSLTSLVIPNTVSEIHRGAFWKSGINNINIPTKLEAIVSVAFAQCPNLTQIIIPNNIKIIEQEAFGGSGLKNISIPSSVIEIGYQAFNCKSLESVVIEESEEPLTIDGGILSSDKSNVSTIILNRNLQSKTEVNRFMPFYNQKKLTYVSIGKKVTSMDPDYFEGCSSIHQLRFEDGTEDLTLGNISRMYSPFSTASINELYIGRNIKGMQAPFAISSNFSLIYGNTVTSICGLMNCTGLAALMIPNSITSINPGDIPTEKLNMITITEGHPNYDSRDNCNAIIETKSNTMIIACSNTTIPSSVSGIGNKAFWGCSQLYSITIPNNITSIANNAFYKCSNLTEVILNSNPFVSKNYGTDNSFVTIFGPQVNNYILGNEIKRIGSYAFNKCNNLLSVSLPKGLESIGSYAFSGCNNLSTITLPNSLSSIGFSAFCDCKGLTTITIPNSVTAIGGYAFLRCSNLTTLSVPNSVISIEEYAFSGCSSLPSATIPNSVVSIGSYAYSNCSSLSSVVIEDGEDKLEFSDGTTFYDCPLQNVYIGRNIGYPSNNSPFKNHKEGIESIILGENVTEISNEEFYGLKKIASVALSKNLKKIESMAFYGCEGLTELTIPGGVIEIGQQAFDLCKNLKTLRIEEGEAELKFTAEPNYLNNAFQNSPLEEVYIGRDFSFNNSSPLAIFETMKSLTFGEEVLSIQARSFIGCPNLKDVTSYSKVVPTTNDIVFTPSYQTNATLHVPYALYDEYKVANVWKDFGKIVNFEGLYNLVYSVDGEEYKKYVVEQGTSITPEAEPTKEGYIFSGWSEIPTTMPAEDVIVTGTFTIDTTGIENVYSNDNNDGNKEYYNLNGIRIAQPKKGFNIVKMSDGSIKKIFIK